MRRGLKRGNLTFVGWLCAGRCVSSCFVHCCWFWFRFDASSVLLFNGVGLAVVCAAVMPPCRLAIQETRRFVDEAREEVVSPQQSGRPDSRCVGYATLLPTRGCVLRGMASEKPPAVLVARGSVACVLFCCFSPSPDAMFWPSPSQPPKTLPPFGVLKMLLTLPLNTPHFAFPFAAAAIVPSTPPRHFRRLAASD